MTKKNKIPESTKTPKILSAKSDYIFKLIFGDDKYKHLLTSFLQSVLDLPPEEYAGIEIVDPHLKKGHKKDKLSILDVKIKTKSGKLLAIEIQVIDTDEMKERVMFGISKIIHDQLKSGDTYKNIKRAISILITDFVLIEENDSYYNRFRFYDERTKTEFSNIMEINTLELAKLPSELDDESTKNKWLWLRFLNAKDEEELDMLAQTLPEICEATTILKKLSQNKRVRAAYEAREREIRDELSRMKSAERQGEKNKAIEMAKIMLSENEDINKIVRYTGLTKKEIERIRN